MSSLLHVFTSCCPDHLNHCWLFCPASDDEFENLRIKGPNAVQLVKTTPLKLSPLPSIPDTIKEVIYDMLNALAAYHAPEEGKPDPGPAIKISLICQSGLLPNLFLQRVLNILLSVCFFSLALHLSLPLLLLALVMCSRERRGACGPCAWRSGPVPDPAGRRR